MFGLLDPLGLVERGFGVVFLGSISGMSWYSELLGVGVRGDVG